MILYCTSFCIKLIDDFTTFFVSRSRGLVPKGSPGLRRKMTPPGTLGISSMASKYRERFRLRQTILIDESNIESSEKDTESDGTRGIDTDIDTDIEYEEEVGLSFRQTPIQPEMKDGGARLGDIFRLTDNMPDLLIGSSGLDYEMDIMGGRFDDSSEEGFIYDVPRGSPKLKRSASTRSVKFRNLTEIIHIDDDMPGAENFSFGVKNVAHNSNFSMQSKAQKEKDDRRKEEKKKEEKKKVDKKKDEKQKEPQGLEIYANAEAVFATKV